MPKLDRLFRAILVSSVVQNLSGMAEMDFLSMYQAAKKNQLRRKGAIVSSSPRTLLLENSLLHLVCSPPIVQFQMKLLPDETLKKLLQDLDSLGEWNELRGRSVMVLGGTPHPCGAIVEELPDWLHEIAVAVGNICFDGRTPDQVLVNSYNFSQGIGHHCDGPLYAPQVAILSLCGGAKIEFRPNQEILEENAAHRTSALKEFSLYLPSNSILKFSESAYQSFTHGIEPNPIDIIDDTCLNCEQAGLMIGQTIPRASRRISLTFRFLSRVETRLDEFGVCSTEMREEIDRRKAWWLSAITETDY